MTEEVAIAMLSSFGFAAIGGYIMGFAIKKILKIVLKIAGVAVGLFFFGLIIMQYQGYIDAIHWEKVGEDIVNFVGGSIGSITSDDVAVNPVSGWFKNMLSTLGYTMTGGFGGGFMVGFIRTK